MEVNMDGNKGREDQEKRNIEQSELDYINAKRTYDTYQDLDLQKARFNHQVDQDSHSIVMQVLQNAVAQANQVAQNAIETANMVSKQAVRHADIAIDRQWNVDEVAELVANTSTFKDVIAAAVAAALAESLSK